MHALGILSNLSIKLFIKGLAHRVWLFLCRISVHNAYARMADGIVKHFDSQKICVDGRILSQVCWPTSCMPWQHLYRTRTVTFCQAASIGNCVVDNLKCGRKHVCTVDKRYMLELPEIEVGIVVMVKTGERISEFTQKLIQDVREMQPSKTFVSILFIFNVGTECRTRMSNPKSLTKEPALCSLAVRQCGQHSRRVYAVFTLA